jgi:hypothetical protein
VLDLHRRHHLNARPKQGKYRRHERPNG